MIKIELNREEADMLAKILQSYFSDLRMETANTDSLDYRQTLKRQQVFLQEILRQLKVDG